MIEIHVTDQMISTAKTRADDMPPLKNSITKGAGLLAAFLAEDAVHARLRGSTLQPSDDKFDCDIIFRGKKFEVKAKRCNFTPRPDHDCSVTLKSLRQKCDYYIFARVLPRVGRPKKIFILGYIHKMDFLHLSREVKIGDVETNENGRTWTCDESCRSIKISTLKSFVTRQAEVDLFA